MNDEPSQPDIDSRVRAAVRTSDDRCRAIVARALTDRPGTPRRWRRPFAIAAATALALLLIVAGYAWRRSPGRSTSPSMTVTSAGSVVVVQSEDGRRWIVGPSIPRRSGSYTIVLSE